MDSLLEYKNEDEDEDKYKIAEQWLKDLCKGFENAGWTAVK